MSKKEKRAADLVKKLISAVSALSLCAGLLVLAGVETKPMLNKIFITRTETNAVIENPSVKVDFDLLSGTYSAYKKSTGDVYVLNAHTAVSYNDEVYRSINGYVFSSDESTDSGSREKTLRLTGTKSGLPDIILDITLNENNGEIKLTAGLDNTTDEIILLKKTVPLQAYARDNAGIFVGNDPDKNHTVLTGEAQWKSPVLMNGASCTAQNNTPTPPPPTAIFSQLPRKLREAISELPKITGSIPEKTSR